MFPNNRTLPIESFTEKLRDLSRQFDKTYRVPVIGWFKRRSIKNQALDVAMAALIHGISPNDLWLESEGSLKNMGIEPSEIEAD